VNIIGATSEHHRLPNPPCRHRITFCSNLSYNLLFLFGSLNATRPEFGPGREEMSTNHILVDKQSHSSCFNIYHTLSHPPGDSPTLPRHFLAALSQPLSTRRASQLFRNRSAAHTTHIALHIFLSPLQNTNDTSHGRSRVCASSCHPLPNTHGTRHTRPSSVRM
jgi:hypothetical protein